MRIEQWGGLRVRITGGPDGRGGGHGPVVVLHHGFGAPGDDLVSVGVELARVAPELAETRFVFPEAPLALDGGFGDSRAWWMIDMERIQRAQLTGNMEGLTRHVPEGLAEARGKVLAMLDALERALEVSGDRIVLGGFSQGAMLSLDVALRSDRLLAGLALLSGTLIAEDEWRPRLASRHGLPVFMSHGAFDPLLPFGVARQLFDLLREAGLEAELVDFRGAHEIPRPVLGRLAVFLQRVLPAH